MSDRDARGYVANYEGSVNRLHTGTSVDWTIDGTGLEVDAEEGRGYMRQSIRCFLHLDVLIKLLEQNGYTVTPATGSGRK